MKTYELNGKLYRFADDKVPEGAVLHGKKAEKPMPAEKAKEVKNKAKKPANKSKKAVAKK